MRQMREILVAELRFTLLGKKVCVRSGVAPEWVKRTKTKAAFRDLVFVQAWFRDRLAHVAAEAYLRDVLKRPQPTSIQEWQAEKPLYEEALIGAQNGLTSVIVVRLARTDDEWDKYYVVDQKFSLASKSKV